MSWSKTSSRLTTIICGLSLTHGSEKQSHLFRPVGPKVGMAPQAPFRKSSSRNSYLRLFHGDAVGSCGVVEIPIEIQVEARIERERIVRKIDYVDLMISFEVNLTEVILIEEIVGDHETRIILGEIQIVRASPDPKIDDRLLRERIRVADVEQSDLPGLE
jgi:hypothetical protein